MNLWNVLLRYRKRRDESIPEFPNRRCHWGSANMIEVVEIPFSDPVADGPMIQAAAKRALAAGNKVSGCMKLLADLRARFPHLPVGILMVAGWGSRTGRWTIGQAGP